MTTLSFAITAGATLVALACTYILHRHVRDLRVSFRELWQLSVRAGIERYSHTQHLYSQIEALATRCHEHGDDPMTIAEILRAAGPVRPS